MKLLPFDLRPWAASCLLAFCSSAALAQAATNACGSLDNGYGPYDYVKQKDKLAIVEKFHFTPLVESLVSGVTSVNVGADLAYTLHAFPNHHRALLAMARLGVRQHSTQPPGAVYSVECYFDRALRFRPGDTTARMLYANFLFNNHRESDAMQQMEQASADAADNPFTHYNLGLIYMEQKHYGLAEEHAHKAYALGFLQPGLRQQLERSGHWTEPAPAPAPELAPASAPAQ